jgi:hypothetical protein
MYDKTGEIVKPGSWEWYLLSPLEDVAETGEDIFDFIPDVEITDIVKILR